MSIFKSLRKSLALTERICSITKNPDIKRLIIKFKYNRVVSGHPRILTFTPSLDSPLSETINRMCSKIDNFDRNVGNWGGRLEISVENKSGERLVESVATSEAFRVGHSLRINDKCYKIMRNLPEIVRMKLPGRLVPGFEIFPEVELRNCSDYRLEWFVSGEGGVEWLGEGRSVVPPEGRELKVVGFPREGEVPGFEVYGGGRMGLREEVGRTGGGRSGWLRVVSYNVLAGSCTASPSGREMYKYCRSPSGGFRKVLLEEEIRRYGADVVCLQEDDLAIRCPLLRRTGRDNLTTLFRPDRFELMAEHFIPLSDHPHLMLEDSPARRLFQSRRNSLQCTVLRCPDGSVLCVGNTHLYSHPFADSIRLLQAYICLAEISRIVSQLAARGFPVATLLCGDFNSFPTSAVFRLAMGETISREDPTWRTTGVGGFKGIAVEEMPGLELSNPLRLGCALPTTHYTHITDAFSGCIDYIFYDLNSLQLDSFLPFPPHALVTHQVALPNQFLGSDHLALVADFDLKQ